MTAPAGIAPAEGAQGNTTDTESLAGNNHAVSGRRSPSGPREDRLPAGRAGGHSREQDRTSVALQPAAHPRSRGRQRRKRVDRETSPRQSPESPVLARVRILLGAEPGAVPQRS